MQIQPNERDKIALWFNRGVKIREISRRLNRHPSVISRELKRNGSGTVYVAISAQNKRNKRNHQARYRHRHPLKDKTTYAYVLDKLKNGWSPEQISGRLKQEQGCQVIHHETIYQFIYHSKNKDKRFWEYLPRKQKKRRQKSGRKVARCHIPFRVSIHLRPKMIDTKTTFGHWEGDSIEGKKKDKAGLHTEVERLSRLTLVGKVASVCGDETIKVQKQMFGLLPPTARLTDTLDNGKENHQHYQLRQLDMKTYFADPYSSWQRGSNEYHNGLIRRYFPKGTDFATVCQQEIDDVLREINSRPRKVLDYATPQEVFNQQLLINRVVAFQSRM